MLDYNREAARYDATRGGDARADAAARAIESLLAAAIPAGPADPADSAGPAGPAARRLADVGCGTGIVTMRLVRPGRSVLGVDRSAGMAAVAAGRLPGRIMVGDVTRLPLASASVDAVTMVWLLHLLSHERSSAALAEAARLLRPGGLLITTAAKNDAAYHDQDDAAVLLRPARDAFGRGQSDAPELVAEIGTRCGLTPAGQAAFPGLGQGLSPRNWRKRLLGRQLPWAGAAGPARVEALAALLADLPDQDRTRPIPRYQLIALRRDAAA